jgi:hypothetical protein
MARFTKSGQGLLKGEPLLQDEDDPILAAQWRECGRCRERFWSEPPEGIIFVPLFCARCGAEMARELRAREAARREQEQAAPEPMEQLELAVAAMVAGSPKTGPKKVEKSRCAAP